MPRTELIFTDEEINRIAERIAYKLSVSNTDGLTYGTIARYKKCTIYFECDEKANDVFVIRDENNDVIGKFIEENEKQRDMILGLLESAAEEIENCYGRDTELSDKLRRMVYQMTI